MKNTIKHLLVLSFTIAVMSLFGSSVNAQAAETCGYFDPDQGPTKCCAVDPKDVISSDTSFIDVNSTTGKWGCPKILWVEFCISDYVGKAQNTVVDIITGDSYKDLQNSGLGVCLPGGKPDRLTTTDPNCKCIPENDAIPGALQASRLCYRYLLDLGKNYTTQELLSNAQFTGCIDCMKNKGYWSAIGCLKLGNFSDFIASIFGTLIGLAGLVSMGCIIYASILIQVSRGEAEKIQEARDMITSCITGLLMVIFSVFILRIIGVDILRIPFFS